MRGEVAQDSGAQDLLGLAVGDRHGGIVGFEIRAHSGLKVSEGAAAGKIRGVHGDI